MGGRDGVGGERGVEGEGREGRAAVGGGRG